MIKKSYFPCALTQRQTVNALKKGGVLQVVFWGVESRFQPSKDSKETLRFIQEVYQSGGFFKSAIHLSEGENQIYREPYKFLAGHPELLKMFISWNEADLAMAKKHKQRKTKELSQRIATVNFNKLMDISRFLYPSAKRHEQHIAGGRKGGSSKKKNEKQDAITEKIWNRYLKLLKTHESRNIASMIAREMGVTSRTIRNHLDKKREI